MPTEFLKNRHATFLTEVAGTQTVQYVRFDDTGLRHELTGEITDEEAAYAATPISLPALVEFNPTEAMREKIGQEIDFDAVIRVSQKDLEGNSITLQIGDAFILPGSSQRYCVKKYFSHMQKGDEFLEQMIAIGRKVGRRG